MTRITILVPDELAERAAARGLALEAYAEEMLARQMNQLNSSVEPDRNLAAVGRAIDRIEERRKRFSLGGLTIRHLIDEGRDR